MNQKIWVTKDGRKLEVTEMTDEHLRNTHKMLNRGNYMHSRFKHAVSAPHKHKFSDGADAIFDEFQRRDDLGWSDTIDYGDEEYNG